MCCWHGTRGREDVVVGTPIAGRKRTELESLIGFFLNTLVLRTDVSGNPSFAALLERVKHTALEAYEHQELPFEKLVEELQPVRNTSHTPIVQVMFNLHNEPHGEFALHGLKVSPFNVDRGTAKFDLTVAMVEGRSGLSAGFEYNTDLFEAASIEQMLAGFETLLAGIVADPNAAVAGLPLLSAPLAPALQPQVRWQVFPAAALDDSIVARFERQAVAADERPAVVTAAHRWSYRELNRRANGVAHGLLAACGDGEQRVGLLLGHDAPMLAGLLGALKAGKAYVPLDPGAPPARLAAVDQRRRAGRGGHRPRTPRDRSRDNERRPGTGRGGHGDTDRVEQPRRSHPTADAGVHFVHLRIQRCAERRDANASQRAASHPHLHQRVALTCRRPRVVVVTVWVRCRGHGYFLAHC